MTYIPPDGKFSPGSLLGDAKSMNMRTVPYEVDSDGKPYWKALDKGSVVYIDESGYAVPFTRDVNPTGIRSLSSQIPPYGVVWKMTVVDPKAPECSTNEPTVTIVTNGVIGVEYDPYYNPPKIGSPINEYGGLADGRNENEHVIGICDAVGTDPEDPEKIVVAVRLTPLSGAGMNTQSWLVFNSTHASTVNDDEDDGTIPAYAPVRRVLTTNTEGLPSVKRWTTEAQDFYGYAAEPIPPGGTGRVVTGGLIELPYVLADNVNDMDTLSRGYRDVWVLDHTVNGEPWYKKLVVFVKSAAEMVGDVCSAIVKIGNAKRDWNLACQAVKDKKNEKPKMGKLSLTSSNEEPVIDGWLTVDVKPVTIHSPTSLDYAVPEDNTSAPIPGHVYGGSDSGVREFLTNWDGMPFFGVCTALPMKHGKTPFLREGAIDVVAADDWDAGDYIDYTRHSIPEAYEPYIPHIGVAQADTKRGELGAVHLTPWDPNTYEVHRDFWIDLPQVGSTVYMNTVGPDRGPVAVPESYDGASTYGLFGILRRATPVTGEKKAEAVVQTGGYVVFQYKADPYQPLYSHQRVFKLSLYREPTDKELINLDKRQPGRDIVYLNVLGRVVDVYSQAEASLDTYVVKLDIQNNYYPKSALPSEESGVPVQGVPVWMTYNKVIHFGWTQADTDSGIVLQWKDQDADVITLGVDPSIPELREWMSNLLVYLACPDGTVITAPAAMGEECCMSLAALNFYRATECNILKDTFVYALVMDDHIEAHFQLNELTEEQLEHLTVGDAYTYYFGISSNRVSTMANGYVTLIYDGEYRQSPEPSLSDNNRHEPRDDHVEPPHAINSSEP